MDRGVDLALQLHFFNHFFYHPSYATGQKHPSHHHDSFSKSLMGIPSSLWSRLVLREIKNKDIRNIIVDTDPNNMNYFFRVILQLQMNNDNYHYMFTSFDIEA